MLTIKNKEMLLRQVEMAIESMNRHFELYPYVKLDIDGESMIKFDIKVTSYDTEVKTFGIAVYLRDFIEYKENVNGESKV